MEDKRKFSNVSREERRKTLADIINKRARRSGCELPAETRLFIDDVEDMILEQFPYITIEEIEKAQENGFSGKYSTKALRGGIYADKIIAYIRAYREEMGYYSKTNVHQTTETEGPTLTSAERIKGLVVYWFQVYSEWINGWKSDMWKEPWGPYSSTPARLVYDALHYMGVLEAEPHENYRQKAVARCKNNHIEQDVSVDDISEREIKETAKKLFLIDYCRALQMEGRTIEQVIRGREVPQKYINMRNYELTH